MIYNYDGSATAAFPFPCVIIITTHHIRDIRSLLPGHIFLQSNHEHQTGHFDICQRLHCIQKVSTHLCDGWRDTFEPKSSKFTHKNLNGSQKYNLSRIYGFLWHIIIMGTNCERKTVGVAVSDVHRSQSQSQIGECACEYG